MKYPTVLAVLLGVVSLANVDAMAASSGTLPALKTYEITKDGLQQLEKSTAIIETKYGVIKLFFRCCLDQYAFLIGYPLPGFLNRDI